MAVRTTSAAVLEIIEESDPDVSMTPFIETASALVDELLADTYSDTHLEIIERWLAAHFYAVRFPRATQETVRGISEKYESYVRLALDVTRYGQQVRLLDYLGILAGVTGNKGRITATAAYIGGCDSDCYTDPNACACDDDDDEEEDDDDSGTGTGTGTGT